MRALSQVFRTNYLCVTIFGNWLISDGLNTSAAVDACPMGLGAQASSPARVPPNQQPLTNLVALDTGRRGRLRSQDRAAFFARATLACRDVTNRIPEF